MCKDQWPGNTCEKYFMFVHCNNSRFKTMGVVYFFVASIIPPSLLIRPRPTTHEDQHTHEC